MKKLLTTMLLAASGVLAASAANEPLPLIQNVQAYESCSLNGDWNYIVDVQEEGYYDYRMNPMRNGFFINAKPQKPEDLIEYDFDKSPTMKIPSDWNTQDEKLFFYEGTVWFKNGFTPFNYDISDLLKKGENTVIVKVDNKRHAEDVPTQIFDWWNYGGITRDVKLVKVPLVYMQDYNLQLSKAADKAKVREITFSAQVSAKEAGHKVVVNIPELKLEKQFTTDAEGQVSGTLKVAAKKLQLWSPENPKLYRVDLTMDNSTTSDEIGFRTIETRGKQILLNGKPIFLKGISIHNEKPNGGGRANSVEDAHTLLSWAKELGCNFVRLAHYPHHEEMVREAERMGILVWSEIPVYWTIAWTNPNTFANAKQQLTDMIARDHNRANVIIWSIANETPHSAERDKFLGGLAKYARTLDNTRLISMAMEVTGASNYVNRLNDNMNEYVDVVSFNQYIGWYRDVNDAPKMKWVIPYDKPVIISEFGGGARYGYHGAKNQRWTEEFQENLYKENTAMLDKIEGLAGTTPWILKDFRSPRRVLPGVQDYYNRKGLVSDKGEKKLAFYVLKKWYETK